MSQQHVVEKGASPNRKKGFRQCSRENRTTGRADISENIASHVVVVINDIKSASLSCTEN